MAPKFANLKSLEVIRALEKGGFYIHEQSGSHVQMKHPIKPGRVTIPIPSFPRSATLGSLLVISEPEMRPALPF